MISFNNMLGKRNLPNMLGTVVDGSVGSTADCVCDLRPGQSGTVKGVAGDAISRLRLMEMGITPGTQIKLIHRAALGGPLHIEVRGYQLSLRREEARHIELQSN